MKNYLVIIFLFLTINGYAQGTQPLNNKVKLDQNSIVKDENGTVMPYEIWRKLTQASLYGIKPKAGTNEFVLYQLNEEQKAKAEERRKLSLANAPKPSPSTVFKEGDKFRGEKMTAMNGNKFDLKNLNGKIYVLNFWFINCPPCRKEIPELNELVKQYEGNKDVVFIAVGLDKYAEIKEFIKGTPFNYNIVDNGDYYADKYNVTLFPTHVIVGKDGLIKFSAVSFNAVTGHWIKKTIDAQLAEATVN